ncbi:hypothetical protein LYSIN_01973 [Lysinibacillus sphaericus]|uniref:Uncharacterized protein n=1 Tax=Lysinibacillus sphaericus TaxID=1421 RepID=A0A2S5D283_LYSSH|nr:hypothetical protein [Lysinibacillus sphaericus]POZ57189.1 hypothetical protein LYSIN_01973 [Lysinibacillus sphaericus]
MTDEKQPDLVEEKLFTQSELDEIISKRLARQHKKHVEAIRVLVQALTNEEVKE